MPAPPAVVKAWRAVLPKDAIVLPVGGIKPDNMKPYVDAGANGFGLGSALCWGLADFIAGKLLQIDPDNVHALANRVGGKP